MVLEDNIPFLYPKLFEHLFHILHGACTCEAGHAMQIHAFEVDYAIFSKEGTERLEVLIG